MLLVVLMFYGGGWVYNFNDVNGKDWMLIFLNWFFVYGFIVFIVEYWVVNSSLEVVFVFVVVLDVLFVVKWCWDYMDYFYGDKICYVVMGVLVGGYLVMMVGMIMLVVMFGFISFVDYKIVVIVDGYGFVDIELELGGVVFGWIFGSLFNCVVVVKLVNLMIYVCMDILFMIVV